MRRPILVLAVFAVVLAAACTDSNPASLRAEPDGPASVMSTVPTNPRCPLEVYVEQQVAPNSPGDSNGNGYVCAPANQLPAMLVTPTIDDLVP